MNKKTIFAIITIFTLLASTLAYADNTNSHTGNQNNGVKLEDRETDEQTTDEAMTIDVRTLRDKLRHYRNLTDEQQDRLGNLTEEQLEKFKKSRLTATSLGNLSDLDEDSRERISNLTYHALRITSEETDYLNKASNLSTHQINQLNHFTRAKIKQFYSTHNTDELKKIDFTKERILDEHFSNTHLTKRKIPNPIAIRESLEEDEDKIANSENEFSNAKDNFHAARDRWNECRETNAETTDCQEKKTEHKEKVIKWLDKTVDHLINKLERLKHKLEANDRLSDGEVTNTIEQIDNLINSLNDIKQEIAGLTTESSGEEIANIAKKVKQTWLKVHTLEKRIHGELVGRHTGEIIVRAQHLEDKLNQLLERLAESDKEISGLDELVDKFSEHILTAKNHYENAKTFWKEINDTLEQKEGDRNTISELVKKAHKELKEAHNALKEAHKTLKEIVKVVKDNNEELTDSREPFFSPGKELGFFIWQGAANNVNICWNSDGELHTVEGTITSNTDFCKVKPRLYEFTSDKYSLNETNVSFKATIKPHMDCLQIRTQASSLNFDLKIDGEQATQIFIGKDKQEQTENPFDLSINPAKSCAIKETSETTCTSATRQVCGTDGNNYSNSCEAENAGTKIAYNGKCESCNSNSGEICGTNGETYANECALPEGIEKHTEGACPIAEIAIV